MIHASRWQSSRRTIDLSAGKPDPRITEWPRPGTVKSEALSICSRHRNNKKRKSDFLKLTLDKRSLHNRKGDGDVKTKKAFLTKCSNLAFSVMAAVAMIFANCQCSGRAYEPEVPEELK